MSFTDIPSLVSWGRCFARAPIGTAYDKSCSSTDPNYSRLPFQNLPHDDPVMSMTHDTIHDTIHDPWHNPWVSSWPMTQSMSQLMTHWVSCWSMTHFTIHDPMSQSSGNDSHEYSVSLFTHRAAKEKKYHTAIYVETRSAYIIELSNKSMTHESCISLTLFISSTDKIGI